MEPPGRIPLSVVDMAATQEDELVWIFFFKRYLVCIWRVFVWRSEDNLWESVLSFHLVR